MECEAIKRSKLERLSTAQGPACPCEIQTQLFVGSTSSQHHFRYFVYACERAGMTPIHGKAVARCGRYTKTMPTSSRHFQHARSSLLKAPKASVSLEKWNSESSANAPKFRKAKSRRVMTNCVKRRTPFQTAQKAGLL